MKRIPSKVLLITGILLAIIALVYGYIQGSAPGYLWIMVVFLLSSICITGWFKRRDKNETGFVVVGLIMLLMFYLSSFRTKIAIEDGSYIIPAEIVDLRFDPRARTGGIIDYEYIVEDSIIRDSRHFVSLSTYKKLKRGDTILIAFTKQPIFNKNPYVSILYKYRPTSKEINQFKKGIYYKNQMLYYNDTLGVPRYSLTLLRIFNKNELALFTDEQQHKLSINQLEQIIRKRKSFEQSQEQAEHFWEHDYYRLSIEEKADTWAFEIYHRMRQQHKAGLDPYSIFTKQWLRDVIKQETYFMRLLPKMYLIWNQELDSAKLNVSKVDSLIQSLHEGAMKAKDRRWE